MPMSRRVFMGTTAAVLVASKGAVAQDRKKLRAAVIGDTNAGGYGHSLHRVWGHRDDIEVMGLADPDEAGRKKAGDEAHAAHLYADYREMLQKEKPDLVAIGPRYTTRHVEYLKAAAEVGAHGLIEKPISTTLAEADEMIEAVTAKNLKWGIGFNFRVLPSMRHLRRLVVEQGLIGDLVEMRGRGKEDHRGGGEDLIVLGTHIFDLMRQFAGDAAWCTANISVEGRAAESRDIHAGTEPVGPVLGDRIDASFGFAKGVVGHFATTRGEKTGSGRWGLDLYGTKGVVTVRQNEGAKIAYLPDPLWASGLSGVAWQPLPDCPSDAMKVMELERYAPIVDDIIAAIGQERQPIVSLQDGRASLEMVHAVYAAYRQGGRVSLPLKVRTHPLDDWT